MATNLFQATGPYSVKLAACEQIHYPLALLSCTETGNDTLVHRAADLINAGQWTSLMYSFMRLSKLMLINCIIIMYGISTESV